MQTKSDSQNIKEITKWLSLSSAGLQMGILIYLGSYFGKKINASYGFDRHWFPIGLSFLGLLISLYWMVKALNKINQ